MDFKLVLKKLNNTLTKEEDKIFDAWYRESEKHRDYFRKVQDNYLKGLDFVDVEKGWIEVSSKINKKEQLYSFYKYAAAIVVLLTTATLLWFVNTENSNGSVIKDTKIVHENQIEVGTDKATLTLEDGSKIVLEKGESYETNEASSNGEQLVYNGEQDLTRKAIKINVLTIPRGGQFYVVLADGTKIWLNSETQLKYPVAFTPNKVREVELVYGEAYFEVSPSAENNGNHFVVLTEGQEVEVLGTEFNIKAYKGDNQICTTLVEGKVLVQNENDFKNLTPGNQCKLDVRSKEMAISDVNVYDEISWKNGFFSFKNRPLSDIMTVLSRWYDIDVIYKNDITKNLKFNGVFRKNLQIHEILTIIQRTNEVNYEINEKTITMK